MKLRITAATAAALAALAIPATASAAVPFGSGLTPTDITATVLHDPGTRLSAVLTSPAGPVAGESVAFTTGGSSVLLCTATTDADGLAACAVTHAQVQRVRAVWGGVWFAQFTGDGTLAPAQRAGHI